VATALSVAASGQETASSSTAQFAELIANLAKLSAEVRELRAELVQQRLERQEETILALRRQLETLKGEQERLDDEERSEGRELQELTERLSQTGLRNDERLQLESVRTALTSSPVRLGAQRSSVAQREARL
jgi:chromosome segregation ATPase